MCMLMSSQGGQLRVSGETKERLSTSVLYNVFVRLTQEGSLSKLPSILPALCSAALCTQVWAFAVIFNCDVKC